MSLVGCFFTPHPPIIVPEVGGAELSKVDSTVQAMRHLGETAARLDPDTLLVMSPHALLARSEMSISVGREYRGSFTEFRAPRVQLRAPADPELAQAVVDRATAEGVPVRLIGDPGEAIPLDHGTMVPLVYLTAGLKRPWRLLVVGFSSLDLETHVRFGVGLARAMEANRSRVLFVASGDLSHRLVPGAPAGYDPRGAEFDHEVAEMFARGDWKGLLAINSALVRAAGECGYRSLAVLAGVVQELEARGRTTINDLSSYEGPFGVGYLVGEVRIEPLETGAGGAR